MSRIIESLKTCVGVWTFTVLGLGGWSFGQATRPDAPDAATQISPARPDSLRRGIEAAYNSGAKKVTVPPGVYAVTPQGNYLTFRQMHDFEIDAPGVTLLRTVPTASGIEFDRCRNVTLRGMTLVNQTPPFTQGLVEAIDPAGKYFDLRICPGYPAELDNPHYFPPHPTGYVFDRTTRQWKAGTSDLTVSRMERLGEGRFRLYWYSLGPDAGHASVGDEMAFRGNGTWDVQLGNCSDMRILDVVIKSGGGFCIHESDGEGNNHYRCTVTYGPRPAGADEDPLIASNADAFHSNCMRHGPTLEYCRFEGMPDDGIAIHGEFALVVKADSEQLVLLLAHGNFFRAGDLLRLFDDKGRYLSETTIKSVAEAPNYKLDSPIKNTRFAGKTHFLRLVLAGPLPATFGNLADDPAANGSGFVIRDCVIRNHRARGMLLKADDGLVENNLVDGSTIAGIVLAPEVWWNEAGYSRGTTVRGNTVRHVGYCSVGSGTDQPGAITVRGQGDSIHGPDNPADRFGQRNITIEDNTVADCDGVNLLVSGAKDVRIKGNRFVDPQQHPTRRGADHVDTGALIQIGPCENVRLEDNTVVNRGPACTTLVKALDPGQVHGADEGVVVRDR